MKEAFFVYNCFDIIENIGDRYEKKIKTYHDATWRVDLE